MRRATQLECEQLRSSAMQEIHDAEAALVSSTAAFEAEREAAAALCDMQQSCVVLNVGGHRFTTSLETLRRVPDTFFSSMFSGRFAVRPAPDGAYFVDRDGTHFRHVLNHMRDGAALGLESLSRTEQRELAAEAEFFGLRETMFPYWSTQETAIRLVRDTLASPGPDLVALERAVHQARAAVVKLTSPEVQPEFLGIFALSDHMVERQPTWVQRNGPQEGGLRVWLRCCQGEALMIGPEDTCVDGDDRGYILAAGCRSGAPTDPGAGWLVHTKVATEAAPLPADPDEPWLCCNMVVDVLCRVPEDTPELMRACALLNR